MKNTWFRSVAIKDIATGKRIRGNANGIEDLANNIKEVGLLQPIIVQLVSDKGQSKYQLLAGFRRLKACRLLGYKYIPAMVKE